MIETPEGFSAFLIEKLAQERAYAEARMRATCRITRPGATVTDDNGDTSTPSTFVYEGKCQLVDFNAHPSTPDVGGASVVVNQPRVLLPVSAAVNQPNDLVEILTDPDNPGLIGLVVVVNAIRRKAQEKSRHLICSDFQSGVARIEPEEAP